MFIFIVISCVACTFLVGLLFRDIVLLAVPFGQLCMTFSTCLRFVYDLLFKILYRAEKRMLTN